MSEWIALRSTNSNLSEATSEDASLSEYNIVFVSICSFGIVANIWAAITFFHFPRNALGPLTRSLFIHQSLVDALWSLMMAAAEGTTKIRNVHGLNPSDVLDILHCKMHLSAGLIWFWAAASTFNTICLTLDRYIAICHPFVYRRYLGNKSRYKWKSVFATAVCIIYCIASLLLLYNLVAFVIIGDRCIIHITALSQRIYGGINMCARYIVPLLIIAICYTRMLTHLKGYYNSTSNDVERSKRSAPYDNIDDDDDDTKQPVLIAKFRIKCQTPGSCNPTARIRLEASKREAKQINLQLSAARHNLFRTCSAILVTFVICFTPNQIIFLLIQLRYGFTMFDFWHNLSRASTGLYGSANPIIYMCTLRPFREATTGACCRMFKLCSPSTVAAGSAGDESPHVAPRTVAVR